MKTRTAKCIVWAVLASIVTFLMAGNVLGQYTVEQVTTGSVNHRAPGINSSGEIVWMQETGSGWQVFSSTRGQLTSPSGNYTEAQYPSLADDGSFVCFRPGSLPCTGSGYLLRYSGESTVEFCSQNGASHRDPIPQSGISSDGSKIIWGRKFYGTSGSLSTEKFFVSGTQVSGDLSDWHNPSVNASGEYVYDFANQVYSSTRGSLASGVQPTINNAGDVAYVSGAEVRVLRVTGATAIVGTGSDPGINVQGVVVFEQSVGGFYQIFRATPALVPDLVAVGLAWNSATSSVDARYQVDNGALTTATTAKVFWANGTSSANILSPTPIFTENIPAGTGGPGSSGVITFNVPASSFGAPPVGVTHLLLVLDYENLVTGENEGNNSVALGPSSVADFPDYSGPTGSDSLNDADANLRAHVEDFQTAVLALPGAQYFSIKAVTRPYEYQAHLRQIRDKYLELFRHVPGVMKDPIPYVVNGRTRFRPRLKLSPGTPSMLCKAVMDHVNQECQDHTLVGVGTELAPGVNKPQNSLHAVNPAQAVDISISGNITDTQIGILAANNGLTRPCSEAHHFQLAGTTCNAPTLGGTIVGNSPITLLVQDPAGRRIGFDPVTSQVVNEIGGDAEYSGTNSEPQVIEISPAAMLSGNYLATGLGTGAGAYSISLLVTGEDASEPLAEFQISSGIAAAGIPLGPVPPTDFLLTTVRLSFERVENGLLLHWPAWTTNLTLQETMTLSPPNWMPTADVNYPDKSVTVTNLSNATKFFRLVGP